MPNAQCLKKGEGQMKNFTYHRPATLSLALPLLSDKWGPTELLGGGTDLLDRTKDYVSGPDVVVSLTGLGGAFREIRSKDKEGAALPEITIGAGAKLTDIAESKHLTRFPALTAAAGQVAGPQIRNMATLGGNLCQRNRCWYFRDEHVRCLLKGGKTCYAIEGENQYHAIFAKGHPCVIVNPSTLAVPLIALGAVAEITGPKGKRELPVEKLYHAPVKETQREHVLAPNEILTAVRFGGTRLPKGANDRNASYEVRQKETSDWPLVQAAVAFHTLRGSRVARGVRVVLGHVAPTPLLSEKAAKALEGKAVTEETAAAAGEAACEGAKPLSQNEYKVQQLKVAVKRAVLLAAGVKPYWQG
jgi:xanthine dehydrogenase YagS FAD-binding subunit